MRPFAWPLLLAAVGGCAGVPASPDPPADGAALPVVALGDSMMSGYNVDAEHPGNRAEFSWPTGNETWSFSSRLGASSKENFARPANKLEQIATQSVELEHPAFVIVGFGINDLCPGGGTGTTRTMAPVPPGEFEAALRGHVREFLAAGSTVLLVSVVDFAQMHSVAPMPPPESPSAFYLALATNCARPAPADLTRDIEAYNAAIARVAAEEGALHDGGALFALRWSTEMVSELDGSHPSVAGHEAMATAVWDASSVAVAR